MKRYATIAAFESALRARLHALASKERTFQDLRKQVAFDRVLARLQAVAPATWLLKGGVALEYRIARARATLDIDISTELAIDEMSDVLAKARSVQLDDYFQIVIGERELPADEISTYRFQIAVQYANGRTFENLKLDVTFADPWIGTPVMVRAPALLDFADILPSSVRAIPAEQHLAEKIHAYTKSYASGQSSRVKDLVDMILLLGSRIDDDRLFETLLIVFDSRGTHEMPPSLPPPPPTWRVPYGRLAKGLPVPSDLDAGYDIAARGLARVLSLLHLHPDR